jgi:formylglycine-generating enzyme required for sulfatase activity
MCRMLPLVLAAASLYAAEMKKIPESAYEVKDPATGIPTTVRVDAFLIGATEVTQQEYQAAMGRNPAQYRGPKRPVENVSWWDAIAYANRLSEREKLAPCYSLSTGTRAVPCNGYRLPTEAEWDAALGRAPLPKGDALSRTAHLGPAGTQDVAPLMRAVRETGTRDAGSLAPNQHGVHDLIGNVWEWCDDWFNAIPHPVSPPPAGLERLIRGGSFATAPGSWARGFRSSMAPERTSRFTGFRLARSLDAAAPPAPDAKWLASFDNPPAGFANTTGNVPRLIEAGTTREDWLRNRRPALLAKWRTMIGSPDLKPFTPSVRLVRTTSTPDHAGTLYHLQVEPDYWERIYVLKPPQTRTGALPVIVVPYYDVDVPASEDLGGRSYMVPAGVRAFALMAVQRGYMAVAIRWFGESYGERYSEAVANLKLRHPNCTGMGKWVWDSQRLLDWLDTQPDVDRGRISIIGHSLGAKMSLYAAAMDERIRTVVFSEGGIGFDFSNYDAYWYFDSTLKNRDRATDQQELLALIAPRPFLLIAGNDTDSDKSWHYVNAARAVYSLFGDPRRIGMINHGTGHSPTPEAAARGFDWLVRFR